MSSSVIPARRPVGPPGFGAKSRRRVLAAMAVVALFAYTYVRGANRGNDFKYPYGAARLLWKGGHLRVDSQPRYPITFHVLLAPLASRSIGTAAAVWAAVSFAAVGSLPWVMGRLSGVGPRRQVLAWAAVAPFFIDGLALGQGDPINLALVAAGLLAVRGGRGFAGAGLIGMAGLIKILPVVHWGTALARSRSPRVFAGIAATVVVGFAMVATAVGPGPALDGFRQQADWIRDHEKPWHLVDRGGDLRPNNESLPIVLARTFGAIPEAHRPREAIVLARLPLGIIWGAWFATLGAMAVVWAMSARAADRLGPDRGLMGTFALTSILMLAATPICWHHYFLWTLPACLFLDHRPRLVAFFAVASLLISAVPQARGLGGHMWLALGLFAAVAWEVHREARRVSQEPMSL